MSRFEWLNACVLLSVTDVRLTLCHRAAVVLFVVVFVAAAPVCDAAAVSHPVEELMRAAISANRRGDFEQALSESLAALAVVSKYDRKAYSNATHLAAHLWNIHVVAAMSLKV